ncbi:NirD/YgiW/YdeI family stress tolerance protein [Vibrio sp. B172a]|nr:NirD/YgiW/YdeI family stress tolerance protein [Vibrio sp. B172a]
MLPVMLLSTSIFASTTQGFNGPAVQQGFKGPFQGVHSVIDALNANDDTLVVLTGNISATIGEEMYHFVDQTGSISVEIDHDKWLGLSIDSKTRIIIYGEVDKDFAQAAMIDVKRVQLAN